MKNFQENIPFMTLILLCCTFLYTCNSNRNTNMILKTNKVLVVTVDSLKSEVAILSDSTIKETEFRTLLELEGYKQSVRNLYHDNAIIRTKERPDDVMHKYNQQIERLTKK